MEDSTILNPKPHKKPEEFEGFRVEGVGVEGLRV